MQVRDDLRDDDGLLNNGRVPGYRPTIADAAVASKWMQDNVLHGAFQSEGWMIFRKGEIAGGTSGAETGGASWLGDNTTQYAAFVDNLTGAQPRAAG